MSDIKLEYQLVALCIVFVFSVFHPDLAMCQPHPYPRSPDPDKHFFELATQNTQQTSLVRQRAYQSNQTLLTPLLLLRYTVSRMIRRSAHKPRSRSRISLGRRLLPDWPALNVRWYVLCRSSSVRASHPCAPSDSLFAFPPFQIFSDSAPPPHASATRARNHIKNAARPATHQPFNHNRETHRSFLRLINHAIPIKQRSYVFRHIPPPQIKCSLIIPTAPTPSTSQDIHVERVALVNLPRTSR